MTGSEPCRILEWDSAFFGKTIAVISGHQLTPPLVHEIERWQAAHRAECLYFLASSDDFETMRLAQSNGLWLVDTRLTLEHTHPSRPTPAEKGACAVRLFQAADLESVRAIARVSYGDSRFYFDPHFARPLCDKLYEAWVDNSIQDPGGAVFIAEIDGQAAGFITCQRDEPGTGRIGLVGVDARFRGQAAGPALVRAALGWFADQGLERVLVTTQGRNIKAQRLYQKCGFLTQSVYHWYHWWFQ